MTDAPSAVTIGPSPMPMTNVPAMDEATARRARAGKKKSKSWTRAAYRTRVATMRTQGSDGQEEPEEGVHQEPVVAHVYESDPKNYGEAMRSAERKGWVKAMQEELQVLEENKCMTSYQATYRKQRIAHEVGLQN